MSLTEILIGTGFTRSVSSLIQNEVGGVNGETLLYYVEDQSIGAGDEYIDFVESAIASIDSVIDLDFQRTSDWQQGFFDINLYHLPNRHTFDVLSLLLKATLIFMIFKDFQGLSAVSRLNQAIT